MYGIRTYAKSEQKFCIVVAYNSCNNSIFFIQKLFQFFKENFLYPLLTCWQDLFFSFFLLTLTALLGGFFHVKPESQVTANLYPTIIQFNLFCTNSVSIYKWIEQTGKKSKYFTITFVFVSTVDSFKATAHNENLILTDLIW